MNYFIIQNSLHNLSWLNNCDFTFTVQGVSAEYTVHESSCTMRQKPNLMISDVTLIIDYVLVWDMS